MSVEPSEILFLGVGTSSVLWYRCALPAMALKADWSGIVTAPPEMQIVTGQVRKDTRLPILDDYKVIVLQQPRGHAWINWIKERQAKGAIVLYEIDDYIHGVAKVKGHDFKSDYTKPKVQAHELCMRVCDGMIVSTPYLQRRYRAFNKHVYLCENGLDCKRYELTRPERSTVNIGFVGATGHRETVTEWLNKAVIPIMKENEDTCFVAIGDPGFAEVMGSIVGHERTIGVPFTMIESYPAAMTMIDIAIAPAGQGTWFRGKSDLRWLESSALGIPVVAEPVIYPNIEHGVTGYHAGSPPEVREIIERLVHDEEERRRVGEAAREHVREHRDINVVAPRWLEVARTAFDRRSSITGDGGSRQPGAQGSQGK